MSKLRVHCFSLSADGYGAGPDQSLDRPMGRGGMALHGWFLSTPTFQRMHAPSGDDAKVSGTTAPTGVDDAMAQKGFHNLGAWIIGRNMFGPVRGPWEGDSWKGWWGDEPPYHTPVFVLTHYPRPVLRMQGGTEFHFVTEGIEAALQRARSVAAGRDIRLGGGVSTLRQYLQAGLVDQMHVAVSPVLLGSGEALFSGLDLPRLGFEVVEHVAGEAATHLTLARTSGKAQIGGVVPGPPATPVRT